MKFFPSIARPLSRPVITIALLLVVFLLREVLWAAPVNPGKNPAAVPVGPEPKVYAEAGGSGLANGFRASAGVKCTPPPPIGSMTFSGGEIMLDKKVIGTLVIGDSATKKAFAWIGQKPLPSSQWICGGAATFLTGNAYGVSVTFANTSKECGAFTFVAKPATVSAGSGVFIRSNEVGSGTLYLPKITTTTAAIAKSNPNRWRKKIGVGEVVTCTLDGAPGGCRSIGPTPAAAVAVRWWATDTPRLSRRGMKLPAQPSLQR